ncbi:MAG: hypothetical protein FD143_513 [Ignavibacteria bacterium]|nr:MAG: hypothetical protein FD143_513 [Ignavibacteria bacterium]KAF0161584.1 MAG: hypothetical protein FD188_701 [Ignavibacteria bacterium]
MKRIFLFIVVISLVLSTSSFSLPRFALSQKDKCADCHVNPTGGIVRNENGFFFGKNVVSMISPREEEFKLSPKFSESVLFGFDYRSQFMYSEERKRSDFMDMTGSVYLSAALAPDIDVIARYDFVQRIWEGYGIAKILPNESYIKAGSFVPYFGLRLDDHTAYTRGGDYGLLFSKGIAQGLIYNPLYVEAGVELGANLSENLFLTASVGKPKSHATFAFDPTYTARLEYSPVIEKFQFTLGGSFASAKTNLFTKVLKTNLYGGFAGVGYKRLTLMGEYDIAKDYLASGATTKALMLEAAYNLMIGLDAVFRYDKLETGLPTGDTKFAHLILGVEFFPYSFVELRPQYRINYAGESKEGSFVLQFHFWY